MKRLLFIGTFILVFLVSCKKTEEPSTEDLLIDHAWNLQSATVDNQAVDYYDGFTISFSANSYTTTNGGTLWESTGSWSWSDDTMTIIVRDDLLELRIESISADQLVLTFVWNTTVYESGRVTSIEGDHRMVLVD